MGQHCKEQRVTAYRHQACRHSSQARKLKRTARAGTCWATVAVLCCASIEGCAEQQQHLGRVRIMLSSADLPVDANDSLGRWRRHGRKRLRRRRRRERLHSHLHPVRQLLFCLLLGLRVAVPRAQKHSSRPLSDGACLPSCCHASAWLNWARIGKRLSAPFHGSPEPQAVIDSKFWHTLCSKGSKSV